MTNDHSSAVLLEAKAFLASEDRAMAVTSGSRPRTLTATEEAQIFLASEHRLTAVEKVCSRMWLCVALHAVYFWKCAMAGCIRLLTRVCVIHLLVCLSVCPSDCLTVYLALFSVHLFGCRLRP